MTARIVAAVRALPPPMHQAGLSTGFFREHYADGALARTFWDHSAITTRRGVIHPAHEDVS